MSITFWGIVVIILDKEKILGYCCDQADQQVIEIRQSVNPDWAGVYHKASKHEQLNQAPVANRGEFQKGTTGMFRC